MAKEQFKRTKPHVNVGTIGHVDHGKSTLTAAIVAFQSRRALPTPISYADITKGGTVRDETKTVTIAVSHVEYQSDKRHYAHVDCPGHADYREEHDHRRRADGRRDPRRLRAADGPMPQTREHILLARQVGVPAIVVFLNKWTSSTIQNSSTSSRWKFAICSPSTNSRATKFRSSRVSAPRPSRATPEGEQVHPELDRGGGRVHPAA